MNISIIFGIIAMFCWGTADYIQSLLIRRIGTPLTMIIRNLFTLIFSVVSGAFLFYSGKLIFDVHSILIIIVSSLIYVFGYMFYMRGFERGKTAVVAPIASSYSIITVLLSYFILQNTLSALDNFAIFLIVAGVFFISTDIKDLKSIRRSSGVREAVLTLFFFGVAFFILGFMSSEMDPLNVFFYSSLSQGIIFILFGVYLGGRYNQLRTTRRNIFGAFLIHSIVLNSAWAAFFVGTSIGNVALVAPISSVFSSVTVILALLFSRERLITNQYVGILSSIIGIGMLAIK